MFVSRCHVQVLVSVKRMKVEGLFIVWRRRNLRASIRSSMCLDERIKFKCEWGGKPVKGSLFNEDLSLHEAEVDGLVHARRSACIALGWTVCSTGVTIPQGC